ncbi:MAG: MarR family transcriptional regulator [Nocardioidaceae bacterium]
MAKRTKLTRPRDAVDRIGEQWAQERPDLDVGPMMVIGRLHRLAEILDQRLRPVFAEAGLGNGEFDILASLRRAGAPYELTPTQLAATSMVTSGAVTKRVDRLERQGFVSRSVAEGDARGRVIALTGKGKRTQEALHPKHLANEDRLLRALDTEEREQLALLLSKLLVDLDGEF